MASFLNKCAMKYGEKATFVCISCAGPELSINFGNELQLSHCVNSVALESPRWGQLGCNGLIVLNSRGEVVCPATSAFLQVRDRAFEEVEKLLSALLDGSGGGTHSDTSTLQEVSPRSSGCGEDEGCDGSSSSS